MSAIPQSQALAEAKPDSLSELFSKDPEGYTRQELSAIVMAMRSQRERLAKTESEPKVRSAKIKITPEAALENMSAKDIEF